MCVSYDVLDGGVLSYDVLDRDVCSYVNGM